MSPQNIKRTQNSRLFLMVVTEILGTLYFDSTSFTHKFERIHFDTPQGQIDVNTNLFSKKKKSQFVLLNTWEEMRVQNITRDTI